jgi:hypothetical protein
MINRRSTLNGKDFTPIDMEKINRCVLPVANTYRKKYQKLLYLKETMKKKVYFKILKGLESEILSNLHKTNEREDKNNYLLIRNKQREYFIENGIKFFFSKNLFKVDYIFKDQHFVLDYEKYERLKQCLNNKVDLLKQLQIYHQKLKKVHLELEEKNQSTKLRLEKFQEYVVNKNQELEKLEKEYNKYKIL